MSDEQCTEEPKPTKKSFGWHSWLLVAVLFAIALALLTAPMTFRARKKPDITEATNNVRQIGFALLEFDSNYGVYPNPATATLLAKSHPEHGYELSGKSSNAFFRQFFVAGLTQSEAMFRAKIKSSMKPDGIITPGKLLEKGENGFSYVAGLSSKVDPSSPILLTPLIPGTTKFDPKPFKGFAVVLYPDNSVRSYKIAKDGHVYDDTGIDILSPKTPSGKAKPRTSATRNKESRASGRLPQHSDPIPCSIKPMSTELPPLPPLPPNPMLLKRKPHNRKPKWFKAVLYICIGAIALCAIALLLAPLVIRVNPHADQRETTNNARQIGIALLEFDMEYGAYPSAATIPLVSKSHPAHGYSLSGKSSNAHFRQLFAVEFTYSERMFYSRTKEITKGPDGYIIPKGPDNIITHGETLKEGECGFSYISGLSSISADPLTPLVLTPLIPGTTKFDRKPLKGFAVVLHTDNSVRSYKIAKDGHVYDDNGFDILSPKHPIWKGKAPDIRYPE